MRQAVKLGAYILYKSALYVLCENYKPLINQ